MANIKNQQIEAIREACIKANPEIVELKFGCYVDSHSEGVGMILGKQIIGYEVLDIYDDEGNICYNIHNNIDCYPQTNGRLCIRTYGDPKEDGFWNLLKDKLEDQSAETIEFIFNLIKQ